MKLHKLKNQKLKKKWVSALRSGKFKQGKGDLYATRTDGENIEERYCCLGVLGSLLGMSKVEMEKRAFLPKRLDKVLGPAGGEDETTQERLAKMNDGGKSFKQISAYINRYM